MRRVLIILMLALPAWAAELDAELQTRYQALIAELRCLVCQNQNIAESNAPLAQDLRAQVKTMLIQGESDASIKAYMVERYGDFVLYRPPVKPQTWLLWGGPFLLLFAGLLIAWRLYHRKPAASDEAAPDTDALRRALQEDEPS